MSKHTTSDINLGAAGMVAGHRTLASLAESHPAWFNRYEVATFEECTDPNLHSLLLTAPNDFAMGVVYGKLAMLANQ